jgi:phenylpropionate dioxygenase-like ring-hydroxylating dioxygenase large terminal subunit
MTNFSWTKQWYPVTPVSYLDPSGPTPITLLGKKLVIWRDKQQKWIAMDDTCPHKLAQLSLGSIEKNGNLMCRHHGWCFDRAGKCTNIPMLSDEKALETACIAVLTFMRYKVELNDDCSNSYCLLPAHYKVYLTQPRIAIIVSDRK